MTIKIPLSLLQGNIRTTYLPAPVHVIQNEVADLQPGRSDIAVVRDIVEDIHGDAICETGLP